MTTFQQGKALQAEEIATAMELLSQTKSHFSVPQVTVALLKGNVTDTPINQTAEYGQVYRHAKIWRRKGFIVRQPRRSGPPDNAYMFSITLGINLSEKVRKLAAQNMRAKTAPKPPLFVPSPKAPPAPAELLNGLPYIPTPELRGYLGKVIEALEVLKDSIPPVLALLLDLDRDFDRFNKVKESLDNLKSQLGEIKF
jgi:hypothetical protein